LIRSNQQLRRLDSLLQAALLLRLREHGCARDYYYDLVTTMDADSGRIDAFSFGVLDALVRANLTGDGSLPLLLYLMKLDEHGPGAGTVDSAEVAMQNAQRDSHRRYVELGRRTAVHALEGGTPSPGGYAELLLDELTTR
jgi:hypothetical protein